MTIEQLDSKNKLNEVLTQKLLNSIDELSKASVLQKDVSREKIIQFVREIIKPEDGLEVLYHFTPQIVEAGYFTGGGWEREDKLLPEFVRGTFLAGGSYPLIEIISELRVLCIATGKIKSEFMSEDEAKTFLTETLALNLDIIFDTQTEETRVYKNQLQYAKKVLNFITDKIELDNLFDEFVREVEELSFQRPIITDHLYALIESGQELVNKNPKLRKYESYNKLEIFLKASSYPTPLAQECDHPLDYRSKIKTLTVNELEKEAINFGELLKDTGVSNIFGVILLRYIAKKAPELVPLCLGINDSGKAHFEENQELILNIIRMTIRPSTANTIYGLSCFLERQILSQSAVLGGIEKLVTLSFEPTVASRLLKRKKFNDSITANALIISGLISVLGQPLGVGQGKNPTCQAARGISLWSQYNPGYLIDILISACRNNVVHISFEGEVLNSIDYLGIDRDYFDPLLDSVSLVLSPHLDALYGEILRRSTGRGEDPHKWANPALYGRLVNFGFDSVLDISQTYVKDYENFVRRFYSTHHPDYLDGSTFNYANPVGIFITNSHGVLIGLHAVSIQRIKEDEMGGMRVYFFNPNNEGRQNWGQGVNPTVHGHGEVMGESSLPFGQFASRLYAFHYDPYEEGDGFAVSQDVVEEVTKLAKESWGKAYQWSLL
tara:strand:+ start:201827 stop:203824 length:1998 start_codon:yes stop_codon:yes gene_type:complete